MKHGQKSEKKAAKTVKKASHAKTSKKAAAPKGRSEAKGGKKQAAPSKSAGAARKSGSGPTRPAPAVRSSKAVAPITFSNAPVAAGFKRALKKYPNALRRLSD